MGKAGRRSRYLGEDDEGGESIIHMLMFDARNKEQEKTIQNYTYLWQRRPDNGSAGVSGSMQRRPGKASEGVSGSMQRSGDEGGYVCACVRGANVQDNHFFCFFFVGGSCAPSCV